MSAKTRADLTSEITALLVDTAAAGSLTPEVIRAKWIDLIDSCFNKATDTNLQGLYPWDATVQYYTGAIVQYDYKWYKANTDPALTGLFDTGDWDFQGYVVYSGSTVIETAEVLTLNGTPVKLLDAIASKYIRIIDSSAKLVWNSVEYATNTDLEIYTDTGTTVQANWSGFLAGTADKRKTGNVVAGSDLIVNKAIYVKVPTGNPTLGNSQLTVYYNYIVID